MYRVRHQTKAIGKAIGRTVMLLLLLAGWGTTEAKRHAKTDDVLNLVASYPALICSTPPDSFTTFSYAKVLINVDRRNLTLATAPTLFYLMHDNRRHFLSESYVRLTYHRDRDDVIEPLLYLSTIYNRHRTLPNLRVYLLPSPYEPTLFAGIFSRRSVRRTAASTAIAHGRTRTDCCDCSSKVAYATPNCYAEDG